jgi:hypothetical protein
MWPWDYYALENVLCRTIGRNPNIHGRLSVKDGFVNAYLASFGNKFDVKWSDQIAFRLEQGPILTFIDKDLFLPGYAHAGNKTVYKQHLWSSLSVCGPRKWNKSDRVGAVSFELSNPDALYDPDALQRRLKQVSGNKFATLQSDPKDLIEICCNGFKIFIYFGFTSGGENFFSEHITINPNICIDFNEGVMVEEAVKASVACARFFGFSIAHPIIPKHISVIPYIERKKPRPEQNEFLLNVPFPKVAQDSHKTDPRDSAWFLRSDEIRQQLSESLRVWMDRQGAWSNIYELLDKLLGYRPMISGDRLEAAFKIVEKVPFCSREDENWAKKVATLEKSFMESNISERFSDKEKERIINRIRSLKDETGTMRIERLFDSLRNTWSDNLELTAWFFGNIREAWAQRGKTAHGKIIIDDKQEFTKLTFAAETFAFMLIASDLELGNDPVGRLSEAKLMTYLHGGYHAQRPDICQKYEKKFPKYAHANISRPTARKKYKKGK